MTDKLPVPRKKTRHSLSAEKKMMGVEAAAIAAVQMENDEYKYSDGARRQKTKDGKPDWNRYELMRRAGYAKGSVYHFDEMLGSNEDFHRLVELHRLRRTDPMFRKDKEHLLWVEIGNEALRNLYEKLFYYPHTLSTEQLIKIVKLILDAGIAQQKIGDNKEDRIEGLLSSISDPNKRERVIEGYKNKLTRKMKEAEALSKAHKGADIET